MSRYTLSAFQREKLSYYFNFFKPNENNELDANSLDHFMNRVLEFTGWSPDSADASGLRQVHEAFFEIMFDKTADSTGKCRISLENWLDVWNKLLPGCMGMSNFPVWLRILPKQLFRAMDRDKDGQINADELFNFYHYMVKMPRDEAMANSRNAYNQMTDYGRYPLDADGYEQIFANFLLGQTPHGPGRHIFGCFEHRVSDHPFQLIQPAKDEDFSLGVKVYLEKRPKRVSITGL